MKRLWQTQKLAVLGFALASAVTLFFLVRLAIHAIYWMDPAHHDMAPQPWMTVGYVAQSWGLDAREIDAKAGFPTPEQAGGHPLTLRDIARRRGVPVTQVITELEAVILTMKADADATE